MAQTQSANATVQDFVDTLTRLHEKFAHRTAGFYQDMEGFFHAHHGRHLVEIQERCKELENQAQDKSQRLAKLLQGEHDEAKLLEQALSFTAHELTKLTQTLDALKAYLPKLNWNENTLAQRSSRELTSIAVHLQELQKLLEGRQRELASAGLVEAPPPPPPEAPVPGSENLYLKTERRRLELDKEELQKQVGKDLDALDLILYLQEKIRRDMEQQDNSTLRKMLTSMGERISAIFAKKDISREEVIRHGVLSKEMPRTAIRHHNDRAHYTLSAILIYVSDFAAILADMREKAYGKSERDALQYESLKARVLEYLVSVALMTEDPETLGAEGRDAVSIIKKFYAVYNELTTTFSKSTYNQAPDLRTSFTYLGKGLADFKALLTSA